MNRENCPATIFRDRAPADGEGPPLDRLKVLNEAGVYTGIWWYADHPTHYRGDGRPATAENGNRLLDAQARTLARTVAAIKRDEVTPQLQREFYAAGERPGQM
jgi:creatinine amidohydrolase